MRRFSFWMPAPDDGARFAPRALDGLIGTDTRVNGAPAKIVAAEVRDGRGWLTVEVGDDIPALTADVLLGSAEGFTFRLDAEDQEP